ncbi:hypothetical protein ES708_22890 [subsurface metagenome]
MKKWFLHNLKACYVLLCRGEKLRPKKKLLILSLIAALLISLLTGCLDGLYVFPNDSIISGSGMYEYDEQFVNVIEQLDTPQKICDYMYDNFTYKICLGTSTPYEFYLDGLGDCSEYTNFAAVIAHYHGYEVYQLHIAYPFIAFTTLSHVMPVYKIGNSYVYSDISFYINKFFPNFRELVVSEAIRQSKTWVDYIVYSWDRAEIIEEGKR